MPSPRCCKVLSLSRQLKMSAHYEPRGSPRKSPIATKKKKSSRTISSSTLLARGDSLSIGSNNNEIDIAVKKAYTKVKRDREAKRSQLVSDALIECRDKVVHNNILALSSAGNKKSSSEGTAVSSSSSIDEKASAASPTSNSIGKKRKINSTKSTIASPVGHSKKKRSKNHNNHIDGGSPTNTNGEHNNNNAKMPNRGNLKSPPKVTYCNQQQQTLVFPRLPSNDCPPTNLHQIIYNPSSSLLGQPSDKTTDEMKDDPSTEKSLTSASTLSSQPNCNLSNNTNNKQYTISIKSYSRHKGGVTATSTTTTKSNHQPLLIQGSHSPLPKSSTLILLNQSHAVEDEPSLTYVPYFEDGDNEDIYSDLFDLSERVRLYELGTEYMEEETFGLIDGVLRTLLAERGDGFGRLLENEELYNAVIAKCNELEEVAAGGSSANNAGKEKKKTKKKCTAASHADIEKLERIHYVLAELTGVDLERVYERHVHCFFQSEELNASTKAESICVNNESGNNKKESSETSTHNMTKSDTTKPESYETIIGSYRDLLCRRCFTYDCNIHGNLPKANLGLLGELAVQKEIDGHWKELDKDIDVDKIMANNRKLKVDNTNNTDGADDLTPTQQSLCEHAYTIFQGNTQQIARAIGAKTTAAVDAYIQSQQIESHPNKFITKELLNKLKQKGKKGKTYTSMNNYNQRYLKKIQSKVIHPAFLPCDHDTPCNEETCSCIQNGFFCTKHCGWAQKSANFFRGCECKAGTCQTASCACYAAKRECDPDLCKTCGACCDPPSAPAIPVTGQRCRNDNISMRRQARTLIAESSVKAAGWGLFTKHALKRGEFVIEYVGEQISQEEAERRGVIYDKMNMSYLFNLSSDLVVDATRKGNHARFCNHSNTPNIEPRMSHVNGGMRIGFFAKHDIGAQSELFFDYCYDDAMDNELIFKPDHSVNFPWMKKKEKKPIKSAVRKTGKK